MVSKHDMIARATPCLHLNRHIVDCRCNSPCSNSSSVSAGDSDEDGVNVRVADKQSRDGPSCPVGAIGR